MNSALRTPHSALPLDIAANRNALNYSRVEIAKRVLWSFGACLFRLTPRPCFAWRRWILRCFGARIGAHVNTYPSTRIYLPWNLTAGDWSALGEEALIYNLGPVTIGQKVTISHRAHLCAGTHDYTRADFPLLKPPIVIHDHAWVCADAFIGPGVTIGQGAVVGARSVVVRDVSPWSVVAGNPARVLKKRLLRPAAGELGIEDPPSLRSCGQTSEEEEDEEEEEEARPKPPLDSH